MTQKVLKNDAAGLVVDERGVPQSKPCDSFVTAEVAGKNLSGIIFRLCYRGDTEMTPGAAITPEDAAQFVMEPRQARVFANRLLAICDQIDGVDQPVQ